MDEGEKPTNPNDASPLDETADVEALLDQAAALAGEIATEAGSEDAAEDVRRGDETTDPTVPEPEAEADPEPETDAPASQTDTNAVVATADAESPQAEGDADEIDRTLASLETMLDEESAEKPADGASKDRETAAVQAPAGKNTINLDNVESEGEFGGGSNFEIDEDESVGSGGQSAAAKGVARLGSIKSLLAKLAGGARGKGVSIVRRFGRGLPDFAAKPLILIDRPFQHLSPRTKLYIGCVAIVTVVAGIASLIVPMLMNKNPYADMPF